MDGRCTSPAAITPEAPNARLSHYGDKFGHLVQVVTLTVTLKRDVISYLPISFDLLSASADDSRLNQLSHLGLQNDAFLILSFHLDSLSSIPL